MKKTVLLLLLLVMTIAAQAATDYNFYVGGVRVTSDNCSNITGSNITSGTAVFTPSDNTLTLTNVTITRTGTDNRAIQSDREGLIIKCVGTCKLSAASSSVIRFNKAQLSWPAVRPPSPAAPKVAYTATMWGLPSWDPAS